MTQSQALAILKTGANVFLTGEPGSGKTYVINEYVAYLQKHGIEPAITASTGIAATHIGGMTIHSWSGIGIRTKLDARDIKYIVSNRYITRRMEKAHVLIIEEVSMLTPDTVSMVDSVCRQVKQNQKPFGGIQVIFVGDFFQLPPVVKKEIDTNRFAYDSSAWIEANPMVCYLTEQHRQDDDDDFSSILSAIRQNAFTTDHLHLVETRKMNGTVVPDSVPKLFSHNADVDRINNEILAKIPEESTVFTMSFQGPDALVVAIKRGCLSPEILSVKVGAAVMFTKNSPKERFVNGTLGIIEAFDSINGYPIVKIRNGQRIIAEPMDWMVEENGHIRAQISQVPLRLAWAITVHKSQGMSLDEAVMDLSDVFEFGQGYVALSRVRRLSGVHIVGWNERAFAVHPDIVVKDGHFRTASQDAETVFSILPAVELQKKHDAFIALYGGRSKTMGQVKSDTHTETLVLWNEGKTIAQIAKARKLTENTILDHVEKLVLRGKLHPSALSRILTPSLAQALSTIHAAFREFDDGRLSPVFQKLNGAYTYDELRIARLLLVQNF